MAGFEGVRLRLALTPAEAAIEVHTKRYPLQDVLKTFNFTATDNNGAVPKQPQLSLQSLSETTHLQPPMPLFSTRHYGSDKQLVHYQPAR
jgi:hypothetical protein